MDRRQNDFYLTIDRAAGLTLDATCAVRSAIAHPLPPPHRELVRRAILALEKAQQHLFTARNDPWTPPDRNQPRQLELL